MTWRPTTDDHDLCRAEVCFGQHGIADDLWCTLYCIPHFQAEMRRFAKGDRVACAVEDETAEFSVWAAGTVTEVDTSLADHGKKLLPHREWDGAIQTEREHGQTSPPFLV